MKTHSIELQRIKAMTQSHGMLRARVDACLEKKRMRDKELAYFAAVRHLEESAAAVEGGSFEPSKLDSIARRDDELGQLARVFQHMATEVKARERRLEAQVQALRISIDEQRKSREVEAITGSSIFEALERKAEGLRRQRRAAHGAGERSEPAE